MNNLQVSERWVRLLLGVDLPKPSFLILSGTVRQASEMTGIISRTWSDSTHTHRGGGGWRRCEVLQPETRGDGRLPDPRFPRLSEEARGGVKGGFSLVQYGWYSGDVKASMLPHQTPGHSNWKQTLETGRGCTNSYKQKYILCVFFCFGQMDIYSQRNGFS